jgi:hypothetical protein
LLTLAGLRQGELFFDVGLKLVEAFVSLVGVLIGPTRGPTVRLGIASRVSTDATVVRQEGR